MIQHCRWYTEFQEKRQEININVCVTVLQTHLQHIAVVVLNPHPPEALQGQHTANAHLMEYLFHNIWKRTGSHPSLSVHCHPQQAADPQVMLVDQVSQGLQHSLLGWLKACMGQDGGHWLIEELPAGGPTQLYDRLTFTPNDVKRTKRWEAKDWLWNWLGLNGKCGII